MPWILAVALLVSVPLVAPHAQTLDPFQTDGVWKSFDRYKDEQKEKLFSHATGDLDADTKTIAAQDAADAENQAAVAESKKPVVAKGGAHTLAGETVAQSSDSDLAQPDRPLDLPVLPQMATVSGMGVSLDTTTEDTVSPLAHIAHIDSEPDLQLPKQNWLDAAEAARLHAQGKDTPGSTALDVRLSFLPGVEFTAPKAKAKPVALAEAKPPAPPPAPAVKTADAAACAAIDAYKKRQLEAIESDRHTLSALQAAIAELGLQKQLNFMAGGDAKTNITPVGGTSAPASP